MAAMKAGVALAILAVFLGQLDYGTSYFQAPSQEERAIHEELAKRKVRVERDVVRRPLNELPAGIRREPGLSIDDIPWMARGAESGVPRNVPIKSLRDRPMFDGLPMMMPRTSLDLDEQPVKSPRMSEDEPLKKVRPRGHFPHMPQYSESGLPMAMDDQRISPDLEEERIARYESYMKVAGESLKDLPIKAPIASADGFLKREPKTSLDLYPQLPADRASRELPKFKSERTATGVDEPSKVVKNERHKVPSNDVQNSGVMWR